MPRGRRRYPPPPGVIPAVALEVTDAVVVEAFDEAARVLRSLLRRRLASVQPKPSRWIGAATAPSAPGTPVATSSRPPLAVVVESGGQPVAAVDPLQAAAVVIGRSRGPGCPPSGPPTGHHRRRTANERPAAHRACRDSAGRLASSKPGSRPVSRSRDRAAPGSRRAGCRRCPR